MKKLSKLFILCALVATFLLGCTAHNVTKATLRDTIFSVEETQNGNVRVWFTHDDIAGYCTSSPELGQTAMSLMKEYGGEVLAEFRTITTADKESSWWSTSACGGIIQGDTTTPMFLLTDIRKAPQTK